jgi:hypothetical protein
MTMKRFALLLCLALSSSVASAGELIPDSTLTRIRRLSAEGSPWVGFFPWFDASFTAYHVPEFCWFSYVATGDDRYLQSLKGVLEAYHPDIPDSHYLPEKPDTHNHHTLPMQYAMFDKIGALTDGDKIEWRTTLDRLRDAALAVRTTDSDETVFSCMVLAHYDLLFGTHFSDSEQGAAIIRAINGFIDRAKGGMWIESFPQYDQNTFPSLVELYRLRSRDFPALFALIKSAAKYLVWATAPDFRGTEFHGDVEGDNNDPQWHYRLTSAMVVSSALPRDDQDNANLLDFLREIIPAHLGPEVFYGRQFALAWAMLFFDPDTLPDFTTHYRPQGLLVCEGRGIVIYRSARSFATFDGRDHTGCDHDEAGGIGNIRWLWLNDDGKWVWVITCLGGYQATAAAYNCPIFAGDAGGAPPNTYPLWTATRGLVSAKQTATGFEASCKMSGPWQQAGSWTTWSYLDQFQRTLSFDGATLTVTDEWIAGNGQRFDASKPFYQGRLFATNYEAVGQDDQVTDEDGTTLLSSDKSHGAVRVNIGPGKVPPPVAPDLTLVATAQQPPVNPPPVTPPVNPPQVVGTPPAADAPKLDASLFSGPAFSVSAWFKADAGIGGTILGQIAAPLASPPAGWVPAIHVGTDGVLRSSLFWHGDVNKRLATAKSVNDSQWHQVVVTYDGTTETLYLDGKQVGQQTVPNAKYADAYMYLVGTGYTAGWAGGNGGWHAFAGQLDNATGRAKQLSDAEVAASFTAGRTPPVDPPPVVLPYRTEYRRFSDRIERVEIIPLPP